MLEIKDLHVHYGGIHAVQGVSMRIPQGRIVTLIGANGAGKSSVARAAAKELGFVYVDTGAIYRTIALHVLRQGVDPHDAPAVEALLPA